LEKYGAEINVANKVGLTPMHIAAWSDLAFPITYLYAKGLDPDQPDADG
jgi:ankyrin repeat protein